MISPLAAALLLLGLCPSGHPLGRSAEESPLWRAAEAAEAEFQVKRQEAKRPQSDLQRLEGEVALLEGRVDLMGTRLDQLDAQQRKAQARPRNEWLDGIVEHRARLNRKYLGQYRQEVIEHLSAKKEELRGEKLRTERKNSARNSAFLESAAKSVGARMADPQMLDHFGRNR